MADEQPRQLITLTAEIAASYVQNNAVSAGDLPALISSIYTALTSMGEAGASVTDRRPAPAVSVRKSIGEDFLICLEDGRKFKSLKRHLRAKYDMSPEDYRARWGLPKTYPMVAPAYAAARSAFAKQMGLGKGGDRARVQPAKATKPRAKTTVMPPTD